MAAEPAIPEYPEAGGGVGVHGSGVPAPTAPHARELGGSRISNSRNLQHSSSSCCNACVSSPLLTATVPMNPTTLAIAEASNSPPYPSYYPTTAAACDTGPQTWWECPSSQGSQQWHQKQQSTGNPRGTHSSGGARQHLWQRQQRMRSANSQTEPEATQVREIQNLWYIATYWKTKEKPLLTNLLN